MKHESIDCFKALLPNFVTEWLGKAAVPVVASVGLTLGAPSMAALAVGGICFYLACSLRGSHNAQLKEELDRKAIKSIRTHLLEGKETHAALVAQLGNLGYDLKLSQAELIEKVSALDLLARQPQEDHTRLLEFAKANEGLWISLETFIQANTQEILAAIAEVKSGVEQANQSLAGIKTTNDDTNKMINRVEGVTLSTQTDVQQIKGMVSELSSFVSPSPETSFEKVVYVMERDVLCELVITLMNENRRLRGRGK